MNKGEAGRRLDILLGDSEPSSFKFTLSLSSEIVLGQRMNIILGARVFLCEVASLSIQSDEMEVLFVVVDELSGGAG